MRPMLIGALLALTFAPLAQAGEAPVKTVAKLDAKDPKYDTEACKAARAAAIDYEAPGGVIKKVISVGANAVMPFGGTAAKTALGMREGGKQTQLSKQVAVACVSDPLNEETPLINAPAAKPVAAVDAPPARPAAVIAINAPAAGTTPVVSAPPADLASVVTVDAAAAETVAATQ